MPENIEISALDLRYEMCRLKVPVAEKILLGSIVENGIRDPLQGVDTGDQHILLDGFKRYRCAVKLGIRIVPYVSLATDEACGLIALLRTSNARTLSIIEQARFIDELKSVHQMTTAEIADLLEKSKAWVSVRSGIINQMSPCVAEHIFAGDEPVCGRTYFCRPVSSLLFHVHSAFVYASKRGQNTRHRYVCAICCRQKPEYPRYRSSGQRIFQRIRGFSKTDPGGQHKVGPGAVEKNAAGCHKLHKS